MDVRSNRKILALSQGGNLKNAAHINTQQTTQQIMQKCNLQQKKIHSVGANGPESL